MSEARIESVRNMKREIGVAIVSLAVIAYAVSYMLGQQEQSVFAVEVVSEQTIATGALVVFGDVVDKTTGKPVRGAMVTLARSDGGGSYTQIGTSPVAADGTFRIEDPGATAGTYRIVVEANPGSGTTRSAFVIQAEPGQAVQIHAELINKEYFVLLPLPGY